MKKLVLTLGLFAFTQTNLFGFQGRVQEIPNGDVNSCRNCHVSFGGSPLNAFGQQVSSEGITAGRVDWSKLWDKDADGDGFTNGQELGDPNGDWMIGDADPGDESLVTKPYDSMDFPTSVNADDYFSEVIASPNPFNSLVNLSTYVKKNGFVSVSVMSLNGNSVKTLRNNYTTEGELKLAWDGTDNQGNRLSAGTYFVMILQNDAFKTIKVALN